MRIDDIKSRDVIKSFEEFSKCYEKVTEVIPVGKDGGMGKYTKTLFHKPKREELFSHPIFGNNYRMFRMEGPFDIDNQK
jgi:hypothetical protein